MRTTQDYDVPSGRGSGSGSGSAALAYDEPRGIGWVVFAAIMLGVLGLWNIFEGIAAISSAHVYVANAHYVFSDLKTWGWIVLILGIAQCLAAVTLLSGSELARWFGVAVAAVNAWGQLAFVPAYPLWGLSMFAVDILIIWALVVHGGSRLRT
jgi:hypothetical protein